MATTKSLDTSNITILHIVSDGDWTRGGVAYAAIRLAHEQARIGLNINILEIDPLRRVSAPWWSINVNYIDFDKQQSFSQRVIYLKKFMTENQIVVHFHGLWSPKLLPYFFLVTFTKTLFIVSPHGSFESGALKQKFFKKYIARKLYLNWIISRATELWACSSKEFNSINKLFPKVLSQVVPIGIDMPELTGKIPCKGSLDNRKIILVISRFNPGKGLLNLVRAWYLIQNPKWRIIIAGPDEDNYRITIEREIRELDLVDYFSFPGFVTPQQRDALYRTANIFVLPSLSENFGIVVAEALSYGLPVLTTNETPWNSIGLDRGCLCVNTDPQSISDGLKVLMELNDRRVDEIGLSAREFIRDNFVWSEIVMSSKIYLLRMSR